jgi:cytochrome P450
MTFTEASSFRKVRLPFAFRDIAVNYFGVKGLQYLPTHGMSVSKHSDVCLRCFRAILHDPEAYPDPEEFKPERFLNEDGSVRDDPILSFVFGFGKRICPGRHFVDVTIYIVISSVLSVFKVTKAKDENGHEIPVKAAVTADRGVVM